MNPLPDQVTDPEDPAWATVFDDLMAFLHEHCAQRGGGVWTEAPLFPFLDRVADAHNAGDWPAFLEAVDDVRALVNGTMFS